MYCRSEYTNSAFTYSLYSASEQYAFLPWFDVYNERVYNARTHTYNVHFKLYVKAMVAPSFFIKHIHKLAHINQEDIVGRSSSMLIKFALMHTYQILVLQILDFSQISGLL